MNDMRASQLFDTRQTTCWSSDPADGIHNYPQEDAARIADFKMGQIEKANWFSVTGRDGLTKDDRNHVRAVRSVD